MSSAFSQKFDYIFTGCGCAALSLVMRMIRSGKFSDKQILLIDKVPKINNDRTWCFWEKEPGFFESVVYHNWQSLHFYSDDFSSPLEISPYEYKMIRGIDFYNYCFEEIKKHKNIHIEYGDIRLEQSDIFINNILLQTEDAIVFNSVYKRPYKEEGSIYLQQHFKGWLIETTSASFNPRQATLMDFRVSQEHGITFSYLLPLSETKALVEYTLFTEELLEQAQYDRGLQEYIGNVLKIQDYKILEEEFAVIPMTNFKFKFYENGRYNIGTAGGQTKASSGYTFQFIQKHSENILNQLISGKPLADLFMTPKRFHFYDTILLRLLKENKLKGKDIFSQLFQRNKPTQVFKFLDNETSVVEELKIIATLPALPFLKAAFQI